MKDGRKKEETKTASGVNPAEKKKKRIVF